MLLTPEELAVIFLYFIKNRVIPYGSNCLDVFKSSKGGLALVQRILTISKGYPYYLENGKINVSALIESTKETVEKGVYIVGLDYTVRPDDIQYLLDVYDKYFGRN